MNAAYAGKPRARKVGGIQKGMILFQGIDCGLLRCH